MKDVKLENDRVYTVKKAGFRSCGGVKLQVGWRFVPSNLSWLSDSYLGFSSVKGNNVRPFHVNIDKVHLEELFGLSTLPTLYRPTFIWLEKRK